MKIVLYIQQTKKNMPSTEIINTQEKKKICNIGNKQNKENDKYELIIFYQKTTVQKYHKHKDGIWKKRNTKRGKENCCLSVRQ